MCRYTTLWNINVRKLAAIWKCIVINDKSQDSTAKHLSCDGLLHYKFISQFAGEIFFKSVNSFWRYRQNGWSSHAPFALDFCPQRRRTRWISKITWVLWTETVTDCCTLIGTLMWVYYQQISNCSRSVLTYWQTDAISNWLTADLYGILPQRLFLCYNSCLQSIMGFTWLVWTFFC